MDEKDSRSGNFFLEKQFINLAEIITNCIKRGEQTVIIPLSFRRENTSHANMLIYRKKTNELIVFICIVNW